MNKAYKYYRLTLSLAILLCLIFCCSRVSTIQKDSLQIIFRNELDSIRKQYDLPGITASFIISEKINGFAASGMADIENNIAMNKNSKMLAASIGKTFISATVLDLVAVGKLNLDSPISKWIGKKKWFNRLPAHEMLTLRNLLTHSSGIPDHVKMEEFTKDFRNRNFSLIYPPNTEQLISYVLDRQPLFSPGKGWAYSDTGYLIVGVIIEEVTGKNFYEIVAERILIPLNLKMTLPANSLEISGLAAGYLDRNNEFGLPSRTTSTSGTMLWNPGIESAGGGFVSNSHDLAKWGKSLFEGKALNAQYRDELLRGVVVTVLDDLKISYGLGVSIYEGTSLGKVYGHAGWIPGYCSSLRYYPEFGLFHRFSSKYRHRY